MGQLLQFLFGQRRGAAAQGFGQLGLRIHRLWLSLHPWASLGFVDLQLPESATAMDRVGAENPVREVKGTIRAGAHAHGAEEITALHQTDPLRGVACALTSQRVVVDAVITPARDHHTTAQLHHRAGAFTTGVDHAQRAAQLPIPGDKGMHRRTAIHPLKAIVRALHDLEQAAGRAAAGIIFSRKDLPILPHQQTKGIPETERDTAHVFPIGRAAEDAAFTTALHLAAIPGGERPVLAEIFPQGEHQAAIRMPGHAAEAVVRVIRQRVQRRQIFLQIAHTIAIRILHPQQAITLSQVQPAIRAAFHMHRGIRLIVKNAAVFAIGIEDQDLIMLRALIALRAEMRVTGRQPDAAFFIHVDPRRRHQIRMLRQQRQLHAGLQHLHLRRHLSGHVGGLRRRRAGRSAQG